MLFAYANIVYYFFAGCFIIVLSGGKTMLKIEYDNQLVGSYLNRLILKKYEKVRRFCIAYLKRSGNAKPTDEEIARMQNRMSQIIKGNKSIQTYDLPIFCDLLDASCEQILSAGKCFVPRAGHITNYEIAFSKSIIEWKEYLERDDKLFLNPDEYNKTVIDYAIEFKNYEFLKFLMDKKYIWFVDESKHDCHERTFGFGAGTSIKRRDISHQDCLEYQMHTEENKLRSEVIALAMENNDFETLTRLKAREVPALYQLCTYNNPSVNCQDYYNADVIEKIARSGNKVLDYFSQEFQIVDQFDNKHCFIYPFMQQLLEYSIKMNSEFAGALLQRSIEHNQNVFTKLTIMIGEAFDSSKEYFNCNGHYKVPVESVVKSAMNYFQFDSNDGFLSYMFVEAKYKYPRFCTNVVRVNAKSDDPHINSLIYTLNEYYEQIRYIQPVTSDY